MQPITRSGLDLPSDLSLGTATLGEQSQIVFTREAASPYAQYRMNKELAAYNLLKDSPFYSSLPVGVYRAPGLFVQEKFGRSLDSTMALLDERFFGIPPIDKAKYSIQDWLQAAEAAFESSPSLKMLLEKKPFYEQLEESAVVRGILGDSDGFARNVVVGKTRADAYKIGNIDWNFAFDGEPMPDVPKLSMFEDAPISPTNLSRTKEFISNLESKKGFEAATAGGLYPSEVQNSILRGQWYLSHQRFPWNHEAI